MARNVLRDVFNSTCKVGRHHQRTNNFDLLSKLEGQRLHREGHLEGAKELKLLSRILLNKGISFGGVQGVMNASNEQMIVRYFYDIFNPIFILKLSKHI